MLVGSLALPGCATHNMLLGQAATDLSELRVGLDRSVVEKELDEPEEIELLDYGSIARYEIDGGYEVEETGSVFGAVVVTVVDAATLGAYSAITRCIQICQKLTLEVLYDSSDRVLGAEERRLDDYGLCEGTTKKRQECEKTQGNRRESTLSPALADAFRRHKLCHDAHRGDADAQYLLSIHYKGGYGGVRSDLVQAYLWRTLASSARVNANIDELVREMSSAQVTEAQRLVAEWEPNLAECAAIGARAEN
jgi:hypothetical protein